MIFEGQVPDQVSCDRGLTRDPNVWELLEGTELVSRTVYHLSVWDPQFNACQRTQTTIDEHNS